MVRLFITNLKREIGTKKEKNLSTRIACRGSRLVEVTGLEPAASASRTQRSTKLSHTSLFNSLCQSIVLRVSSFHESATLTLAVPEKTAVLRFPCFFDRGAFSLSLHLHLAAVKLKATKLSHTSLFNYALKSTNISDLLII